MMQQLESRLEELKTEYESGQKMLDELNERRARMEDSMLRISGAIQVLEEELEICAGEQQEPKDETAVKAV